ncbi:MAG: bfr [Bradyrhizobium sp.]|nr:bfr [Bradyrhizobium sp.]
MKGDPKIVGYLNQAVVAELTAVDEYFIESRLLSNWGFKDLAHGFWRDSKRAHRKNARAFIDRVLFLEGTPTMKPNTFTPATSVEAVFKAGLASETAIQALYNEAASASDDVMDFVSEELFQDILVKTERRIKKIETQIKLIGSVGLELYLQKKI